VSHCLDQLADFLAGLLVAQVELLVEEPRGARHQHLRVGDHDRPTRLSTPRRAACAFAEPDLPSTAPMTATDLLRRTLRPVGREAQSMALVSTPGTTPFYSGVAINTALARLMASLKRWTCSGSPAASSSSLKKGRVPISKNCTSTHSGASSSAARSNPRL